VPEEAEDEAVRSAACKMACNPGYPPRRDQSRRRRLRSRTHRGGRPLGSYDQWCRWVGDPLVALGCCDSVARVSEAELRDPTRQAIVTLFEIWWDNITII
jgi:hypothetical protein